MSTFKICLVAAIFAIVSSRLILPQDLPQIIRETEANYRLDNRDFSQLDIETAASTAKPVENIQNATSGYLSVDDPDNDSKLFYVFYSCDRLRAGQAAKDVPIIIWLQGGPGSSSFLGSFLEFGPYRLEKDSKGGYHEVKNEISWNNDYNLLIVDNPRGTGYSVADKRSFVTDEDQVAEDFLHALLNFYSLDAFSTFGQTPLYIFGESYGGHYVPSIAKRLLEYNKGKPNVNIPLAGIGVGNGWTDPINQLASFGLFGFSMGFLDYLEREEVEREQLTGINNIINGRYAQALNNFGGVLNVIRAGSGGANVYNFRLYEDYDTSILAKFFNDKANAKRYNVDPSRIGTFGSDSSGVYNGLRSDFMKSVADRVAFCADEGLPVILFNGQYDIIVNTATAVNWIGQMEWKGQKSFYDAPLQSWVNSEGNVAGLAKNYKNFTFVVVNKAGHLAPMDQLENSIEMLHKFTHGINNWNSTSSAMEEVSI